MDLAAAASELYGLPPGDFTAARNERAKAARAEGNALLAKQVGRLPKPSTAAWAINMLARRRAQELAEVLDLGEQLRRAQEELDPVSMRELGRQRQRLLTAVVREGRSAAEDLGVGISDAAASELEQTLRAAMADADAAAAVRSGQLVRSLSSNGIEPVDLAGAVAVPGSLPPRGGEGDAVSEQPARGAPEATAPKSGKRDRDAERRAAEAEKLRAEEARRRERAEAQAELEEAERGAEQAAAELSEAERSVSETAARRDGVSKELDELRARVAELEAELEAVEREAGFTERARRLAARLAEQERRAADRARARLRRLS
ncbi:hypothetical protein [Sinomonas sp.]|uniref:hypothetical protein n=1 Tax=Sinomonas sp. TaxID=1914986 RepID=UPI002FE25CA0